MIAGMVDRASGKLQLLAVFTPDGAIVGDDLAAHREQFPTMAAALAGEWGVVSMDFGKTPVFCFQRPYRQQPEGNPLDGWSV